MEGGWGEKSEGGGYGNERGREGVDWLPLQTRPLPQLLTSRDTVIEHKSFN